MRAQSKQILIEYFKAIYLEVCIQKNPARAREIFVYNASATAGRVGRVGRGGVGLLKNAGVYIAEKMVEPMNSSFDDAAYKYLAGNV